MGWLSPHFGGRGYPINRVEITYLFLNAMSKAKVSTTGREGCFETIFAPPAGVRKQAAGGLNAFNAYRAS